MSNHLAELKIKKGCTSKTKFKSLHQKVPKMFLSLSPTPKRAPKGKKLEGKGQKLAKEAPYAVKLKKR